MTDPPRGCGGCLSYEIFEHTADIGLRIRARDLDRFFKDAAEGFFHLVTNLSVVQKTSSKNFLEIEMNFQEENVVELFMRWLQELLFVFSTRHAVLLKYHFTTLTPTMLRLKTKAVRFDPAKHPSRHEVKAVTHHQFRVVREKSGWFAEVIFDI